jgi:hypothetical protein
MASPKTIQIFLPDGDPMGIRFAEITTSIIKTIEFPRSKFSEFYEMPESSQVGIYFLFGVDEESGEDILYIGQSGGLKKRINSHTKNKEFWTKAVVGISLTNSLTQTHVLYLEWLAIQKAKDVGRFKLLNENKGSKPYTPLPLEAECNEIFLILSTLLGTLGHQVFRKLSVYEDDSNAEKSGTPDNQIFYLKRSDAEAKGMMTNEGFVVLAGSKAPYVNKYKHKTRTKQRDEMIEKDLAKVEDGSFILLKDSLFKTPSGAAETMINTPTNGWIHWVNEKKQTLHDVYRVETEDD